MKKERLMAAMYEKVAVEAAYLVMGEEEFQKLFDDNVDRDASIAIGAYLIEHMDAKVRLEEIECEHPCAEHPDFFHVYVTISVEE